MLIVGIPILTPVRDNGLELLELRRALCEGRKLQALELCGYRVGHGCGDCGGRGESSVFEGRS